MLTSFLFFLLKKNIEGFNMKILTIGGATQDIFLQCRGADLLTLSQKNVQQTFMLFQPGEKVELESTLFFSGGGATNAAVSFKKLGFDALCCCALGQDGAADFVLNDLKHYGVETCFAYKIPDQQTGVSYILGSFNGEKTIFVYRGANSLLSLEKKHFDEIKTCQQLYITSLSHASAQLLPELVTYAHAHNIPVAINPGMSQLAQGTLTLKKSLRDIDILILNSGEARAFMFALMLNDQTYKDTFESTTNTNDLCALNISQSEPYLLTSSLSCENQTLSMRKFFKAALSMGPRIVVVTNGANGVYAAKEKTIFFCPSIKVELKNTVGAGDAFGSCFVASLLKGFSVPHALQHGVINSASVLQNLGAKTGLLSFDTLEQQRTALKHTPVQQFRLEE